MKKKDVLIFEKLDIQMSVLYQELSLLAKKSPDGLVNKFKLRFVNQLLTLCAQILEPDNLPFPDFRSFDEETLPSNSDVTLIVNQYITCLEKLKFENIRQDYGTWYWQMKDSKESIETTRPAIRYLL